MGGPQVSSVGLTPLTTKKSQPHVRNLQFYIPIVIFSIKVHLKYTISVDTGNKLLKNILPIIIIIIKYH